MQHENLVVVTIKPGLFDDLFEALDLSSSDDDNTEAWLNFLVPSSEALVQVLSLCQVIEEILIRMSHVDQRHLRVACRAMARNIKAQLAEDAVLAIVQWAHRHHESISQSAAWQLLQELAGIGVFSYSLVTSALIAAEQSGGEPQKCARQILSKMLSAEEGIILAQAELTTAALSWIQAGIPDLQSHAFKITRGLAAAKVLKEEQAVAFAHAMKLRCRNSGVLIEAIDTISSIATAGMATNEMVQLLVVWIDDARMTGSNENHLYWLYGALRSIGEKGMALESLTIVLLRWLEEANEHVKSTEEPIYTLQSLPLTPHEQFLVSASVARMANSSSKINACELVCSLASIGKAWAGLSDTMLELLSSEESLEVHQQAFFAFIWIVERGFVEQNSLSAVVATKMAKILVQRDNEHTQRCGCKMLDQLLQTGVIRESVVGSTLPLILDESRPLSVRQCALKALTSQLQCGLISPIEEVALQMADDQQPWKRELSRYLLCKVGMTTVRACSAHQLCAAAQVCMQHSNTECKEAGLAAAENLIRAGHGSQDLMQAMADQPDGRRSLLRLASDLRMGSGANLSMLKRIRFDTFTFSLGMRLFILDRQHLRLLKSFHAQANFPDGIWFEIVSGIGLFNADLIPKAVNWSAGFAFEPRAHESVIRKESLQSMSSSNDDTCNLNMDLLTSEPMHITHEEAAALSNELWASGIERQISDSRWADTVTDRRSCIPAIDTTDNDDYDDQEAEIQAEEIYMIEYKKYPAAFRDALLCGRSLQHCREMLAAAGHECQLLSGCKMFVHPSQYRTVMMALNGWELRPYHVVVSQSFEHLVAESLTAIPYRQRPREKSRCTLSSEAECASDGFDFSLDILEVERTFLCTSLPRRHARSVVQSTSILHGVVNPRQAAHMDRINAIVAGSAQ